MAEPTADPIVKQTRKALSSFWLSALTATGSLLAAGVYHAATSLYDNYTSIDARFKRMETDIEINYAQKAATWGSFAEQTTRLNALENKHEVMHRIFEREWGSRAGIAERAYLTDLEQLRGELAVLDDLKRQVERLIASAGDPTTPLPPAPAPAPAPTIKPLPKPPRISEDPREHGAQIPNQRPLDAEELRREFERRFPKEHIPNQKK